MITRLYQRLTGRSWTTSRCLTAEFGPPPGARFARELAAYSDLDLIRHGPEILARLRTQASRTPVGTGPASRRP